MAKGLNKHTPDSEELLKRLNSNDSSGLDDFEKEALEGFNSLDNAELAKNLSDSLNKKIDEKYFKKEGGNKKGLMYLSMAAGLVLVVGLSIYFMNIMGEKKEMAMESAPDTEKIANEVAKPTDIPVEEPAKKEARSLTTEENGVPVTSTDALAKDEKKFVSAKDDSRSDGQGKSQPDKDDGLTSRMVLKETKVESPNKTGDLENGDDLKQVNDKSKLAQQGPPSGNVAAPSVVVADTKSKNREEDQTLDANEKAPVQTASNNSPSSPVNSNSLAGGRSNKEPAKKSEAKERKQDKSSGESLGKEDATPTDELSKTQSTTTQKSLGGVTAETKSNETGYYHNAEFTDRVYSKPQDYIKTEIDKSEMLKTNVKAFKAELTIDEKGLVRSVKFLTPFDNCTGCKKELEKILLNMPGWKAAKQGTKSVIETVSFIYP